jgi:AcrR family transcriptional regulator
MSRDTKQAILDMSKELFNQRGYNNVSTRDIASAIGISKGNLTYHFKKKEAIIEALIEASVDTQAIKTPGNLEDLDRFFHDTQQTVQGNAYYFWNYTQFAQTSERIREIQKNMFRLNVTWLRETMNRLAEDEVIFRESKSGEYDRVVDAVLLTIIYWIPFCRLKGVETPAGFVSQAWSVLKPLLTEKGQEELRKIKSCLANKHSA